MGYAVSILQANVWTYLQSNQTNMRFLCTPLVVEEYLALLEKEKNSSTREKLIEIDANSE